MSYAVSKKMSKEPAKFGTGHVEGIIESGSANNSALAGAWIPALVFGIPGDSITAIVIGVLYMKNMNPGPTLFTQNPQNIYAVYLLFIVANLIMIPLNPNSGCGRSVGISLGRCRQISQPSTFRSFGKKAGCVVFPACCRPRAGLATRRPPRPYRRLFPGELMTASATVASGPVTLVLAPWPSVASAAVA